MTPVARRTTALAAVGGALLSLASTLAFVAGDEGLSRGELGGTIELWAYVALGVALVGLARLLDGTAPRAAAALTALALLGTAGGAAYGLDAAHAAVLGTSLQDADTPALALTLRIPGLAFPLALGVAGALLARSRLVAPAAGRLLVVGSVLFAPSRIGDIAPLAIAADVAVLVALAAVTRSLLSAQDDLVGGATRRPAAGATAPAT